MAIEESMLSQVVAAGPRRDPSLAMCSWTDHVAAVVEVALGSRMRAGRQKPWFNRELPQLPSYQERVRELWAAFPPLPADWAADVLVELHAKCCRVILAEACPPRAAVPRRP